MTIHRELILLPGFSTYPTATTIPFGEKQHEMGSSTNAIAIGSELSSRDQIRRYLCEWNMAETRC